MKDPIQIEGLLNRLDVGTRSLRKDLATELATCWSTGHHPTKSHQASAAESELTQKLAKRCRPIVRGGLEAVYRDILVSVRSPGELAEDVRRAADLIAHCLLRGCQCGQPEVMEHLGFTEKDTACIRVHDPDQWNLVGIRFAKLAWYLYRAIVGLQLSFLPLKSSQLRWLAKRDFVRKANASRTGILARLILGLGDDLRIVRVVICRRCGQYVSTDNSCPCGKISPPELPLIIKTTPRYARDGQFNCLDHRLEEAGRSEDRPGVALFRCKTCKAAVQMQNGDTEERARYFFALANRPICPNCHRTMLNRPTRTWIRAKRVAFFQSHEQDQHTINDDCDAARPDLADLEDTIRNDPYLVEFLKNHQINNALRKWVDLYHRLQHESMSWTQPLFDRMDKLEMRLCPELRGMLQPFREALQHPSERGADNI